MATGKVKWFNVTKGYGFIEPDEGGKDVFIHVTKLEEKKIQSPLKEGQKVSFELEDNRGRVSACNIELLD